MICVFSDKLPPVILKSQICALLQDYTKIDSELNSLRVTGKVVVAKLDSGTYGIIDKADYLSRSEYRLDRKSVV